MRRLGVTLVAALLAVLLPGVAILRRRRDAHVGGLRAAAALVENSRRYRPAGDTATSRQLPRASMRAYLASWTSAT